MSRDLLSFPLSRTLLFKLKKSGITKVDDLKGFQASDLTKVADLTAEEASRVAEIMFPKEPIDDIFSTTALNVLQEENSTSKLTTLSSNLDSILGGGIPLRKLTEICGTPGSGKTQTCMQLCANAQIPKKFGGLEGEALYIDTECSLSRERLCEIVAGTVQHCAKIEGSDCSKLDTSETLKHIYYCTCKNYREVIAHINLLHEFLEEHPNVVLVVIDSISFHFRYGYTGSYPLRTKLLSGLSQILVKVANDHKVAVVITNQMTTKFNDDNVAVVPSLGETWAHACTIRLLYRWDEHKREATVVKSPSVPESTARFEINTYGIRDSSIDPDAEAIFDATWSDSI